MAGLTQISFIPEIMCANLSARGQRQGLLWPFAMADTQGAAPGTPDHGPCASDTGPIVLAL